MIHALVDGHLSQLVQHKLIMSPMQPETTDQAQTSSGIIAGEDAKMRITSYPTDLEAVDLCIDARVSTTC